MRDLGLQSRPAPAPAGDAAAADAARPPPTLLELWTEALRSPDGTVYRREQELLDHLTTADGDKARQPLTMLQAELWNQSRRGNVFDSDRHVVIAGATSSGKSTIAEMFMVRAALINSHRTAALYIAPTRALTQAKWRELRQRFEGADLVDRIVISTGEDTDDDALIAHGQFAIACMVYEKANLLFSRNLRLLSSLGCLVVDETHLLADPVRGPRLEIAITKALAERRRADGVPSNSRAEHLRVILISTEDAADEGLERFLATFDPVAQAYEQRPLVVRAAERPVPVDHYLVRPGPTPVDEWPLLVTTFHGSASRRLTPSDLEQFQGRLARTSRNATAVAPVLDRRAARRAGFHKLLEFIGHLLRVSPCGRRILLFAPKRSVAERLALRLRKLRSRAQNWVAHPIAGINELEALLDAAEDQRTAAVLRRCAAAGIFIHHGCIEKRVRWEIEHLGAQPLEPDSPSQVIVATETLSYGVNLAVHDVVLAGTLFPAATSQHSTSSVELEMSDFHNMVGRAGRLGKTAGRGEGAQVFVFAADQAFDPVRYLERYYTTIASVRSRLLFARVQKPRRRPKAAKAAEAVAAKLTEPVAAKLTEPVAAAPAEPAAPVAAEPTTPEPAGPAAAVAPPPHILFPDVFDCCVLDALRHANLRDPGAAGHPDQDVLGLLEHSLWAHQLASDTARGWFRSAVRAALRRYAQSTLRLATCTEDKPPLYRITARGEAIIDTGTAVGSLGPLLVLLDGLQEAWQTAGLAGPMAPPLYVLALLTERTIYRKYVRAAPECARDVTWTSRTLHENRAGLAHVLSRRLARIAPSRAANLVTSVRSILEKHLRDEQAAEAYPGGAVDACVRFFDATIAWSEGVRWEEIQRRLQPAPVAGEHRARRRHRQHVQNFRQFTEQLVWKLTFLARIDDRDEASAAAHDLQVMVERIRLGCPTELGPLLAAPTTLTRPEAIDLGKAELTATKVLRRPDVLARRMTETRTRRVVGGLRRHAVDSLAMLIAELVPDGVDGVGVGLTDLLRSLAYGGFEAAVRDADNPSWKGQGFDRRLGAALPAGPFCSVPGVSGGYRVEARGPADAGGGLVLVGSRPHAVYAPNDRRSDERVEVRLLGIELRSNWSCAGTNRTSADLPSRIKAARDPAHLALIVVPWLPSPLFMPKALHQQLAARAADRRKTTSILSPAAFALIACLLARRIASGETLLPLLAEPHGGETFRYVGADEVRTALADDGSHVPRPILEAWASHFEVRPDVTSKSVAGGPR